MPTYTPAELARLKAAASAGGRARAAKYTPEQRAEIARKMVAAREAKRHGAK